MRKTFCDRCGKETTRPPSSVLVNVERYAVGVEVEWPDSDGLRDAPDLCTPCVIELVRQLPQ